MKFDIKNLNDQQKKLIKTGLIGTGVVIGLVIIFIVIRMIVGTKISNERLETVMVNAARNYVADNPTKITDEVYGETEITISTLVTSGYMKEITKYKGKDTNCNGSVLVFKNSDNYSYSPKLTCGTDYTYKTLASAITDEENIVESGNGLYYDALSNIYLYKGEYVDNFVSFADQLWRILRVDEDGNIRLLQVLGMEYLVWDDRYNSEEEGTVGLNYFESVENSRIKDSLLDYYNNDANFTTDQRSVIIPKEFCTGSISENMTDKTGTTECMSKSELMAVGAPYVSELTAISLDIGCVSPISRECSNYNFLSQINRSFWTITADSESNHRVYVSSQGYQYTVDTNNTYDVNAVVTINGNINYIGGTGTETDPYIVNTIG